MERMEHDGSGREDDGSEDDAWIEDEEEVEREVNASDIHASEREESNLSSAGTTDSHKAEELESIDGDKVFTAISFSVEEATTEDVSITSGKTVNLEKPKEVGNAADFSVEGASITDCGVVSDKKINLGKAKEMEDARVSADAVQMDTSEDACRIKVKDIDPETSKGMRALHDSLSEESSPESLDNPEFPKEQVQDQGQSEPSCGKVCRTLSNSSSSSSQDETMDLDEFCANCYQGFDSVEEWHHHLKSHAVPGLSWMKISGKVLWSFTCTTCVVCKKVFPDCYKKSTPFKCNICSRLFPDQPRTNKQIKTQPLSQEQLGEKKAAAQQDFYTEQVVFKCNLCLKGYASLEHLMNHFSCEHKNFSCQICKKVVLNWENHMKRFHKDDSKLMENKQQINDLLSKASMSI